MRVSITLIAATALTVSAVWTPAIVEAAPTQTTDATRLALARQLYDLSGGTQAVKDRLTSTFAAAKKIVAASLPADRAGLAQAVQQDMFDEFSKLVPSMVDDGAHAYADNLTEAQLRDYIAWLSSDSGKAVIEKMPAIREEMVEREMPALTAMVSNFSDKIVERVCEESHCSASDREVIAAAMSKAFPKQKS